MLQTPYPLGSYQHAGSGTSHYRVMSGFTRLTSWSPFKNTISDGTKNTISDGTENTISNGIKNQTACQTWWTHTHLFTNCGCHCWDVDDSRVLLHYIELKINKAHCTANPTHCAPPRYNHGSNLMQLSPPGKKDNNPAATGPLLPAVLPGPEIVLRPVHQKSSANFIKRHCNTKGQFEMKLKSSLSLKVCHYR